MRAPERAALAVVKVTGSVADSPGARLCSRAVAVLNLTPGVGLCHSNCLVPERAPPLFQNLRRTWTGCPAAAHAAPSISKPESATTAAKPTPISQASPSRSKLSRPRASAFGLVRRTWPSRSRM
jgi:hypothetical protein